MPSPVALSVALTWKASLLLQVHPADFDQPRQPGGRDRAGAALPRAGGDSGAVEQERDHDGHLARGVRPPLGWEKARALSERALRRMREEMAGAAGRAASVTTTATH